MTADITLHIGMHMMCLQAAESGPRIGVLARRTRLYRCSNLPVSDAEVDTMHPRAANLARQTHYDRKLNSGGFTRQFT